MSFGKKKLILSVLGIALAIYFIIVELYLKTWTALLILVTAAIGYIILDIKWWRCPHCDTYLWRTTPFASYCPHCGNELE